MEKDLSGRIVVNKLTERLKLYTKQGKPLSFRTPKGGKAYYAECNTNATNDDERIIGGDTPKGKYKIGEITEYPKGDLRFGFYYIDLIDYLGYWNLKDKRSTIGIHGGGSALGAAAFMDFQNIHAILTYGCCRLYNSNLKELVNYVKEMQKTGTVYLTVA